VLASKNIKLVLASEQGPMLVQYAATN
jgi:hypothetical protein